MHLVWHHEQLQSKTKREEVLEGQGGWGEGCQVPLKQLYYGYDLYGRWVKWLNLNIHSQISKLLSHVLWKPFANTEK